ncbi:MAG: aminotransferase class V-fold PLP-dependent enzyme [Candidatus Fermentibacteraceae bacterium]|nr:aminotransferase class V-fold PLP-dependent enzyme [Candidatus Fermentibacteraceae bacterium]
MLRGTTYLDNLTVKPLLPEARRAAEEALSMGLGDPRSTNAPGRQAQKVLDELESRIAGLLGGSRAVFFGDGDMANGTAVLAAGRAARERGKDHVVSSPVERSSIVCALRVLREEGSRISMMQSGKDGKVRPDSLEGIMEDGTGLLVCSWVNGISGVIQPVEDIAGKCRAGDVWLHCDACFALGRLPVAAGAAGIDSMAVSSVQIGGPPGSATVILRDDTPLPMASVPEFSFCCNIPAISGMAAALESTRIGMKARNRIVNQLRSDLLEGLDSCCLRYSIIGEKPDDLIPGTALLHLDRVAEKVHARMESDGIVLPSHNSSERLSFLRRAGLDTTQPDMFLGFTFDACNTGADVQHFVRSLADIYSG